MRSIVKLILLLAFVACVVWAIRKPGYDSISAAVITLGTWLGAFIADKKTEPNQIQNVGANGSGIQAGRDVKIRK